MELIHPEYVKYIYEVNRLRIKIAELITYRDALKYHITKSLNIDYMLKLGALEYKLMMLCNQVVKDKRIIELLTISEISLKDAEKIVEKESEEEDCKLDIMHEAVENAIKESHDTILSEKEIIQINSYYMPLVKDYSPDINPRSPEDDKLLFEKIKDKYIKGKISDMKKFERYEKSDLYFDELEVYKEEKVRLTQLSQTLTEEINKIKCTYPYTERVEIYDEVLCRRKKDAINAEIIKQQVILDDLEKQIKKFKK